MKRLPTFPYTLEDGRVVLLNDPYSIKGIQLSNVFTNITAPLSGNRG